MRRIALFALAFMLFGTQVASVSAQGELSLDMEVQSGYEETIPSALDEPGDTEPEEEEETDPTVPEESEPEEEEETDPTVPEESEPEEEEETDPTVPEEGEPEEEEETEPTVPEESEPEEEEETEPTVPEESEPEGEEETEPTVPEESEPEGEEETDPTVPEESEPEGEETSESMVSSDSQDALVMAAIKSQGTWRPSENSRYSLNYAIGYDDKVTIQNCTGDENAENWGDLVIPSEIEGLPVVKIANKAFSRCKAFNGTLTLPDSLTSIEDYAFELCTGLNGKLILPEELTKIGNYAFMGCSGFSGTLTLPNSLTTLEIGAFYGCSGFSGDLILPDSLTRIYTQAFYGCSGFDGTLTLPDSIIHIDNYAFYNCSGFKGPLILPSNLKYLDNNIFTNCSGFTGTLTLPDGLKSVGASAFSGCSGFSGIPKFPASLQTIQGYAFKGCTGLSGTLVLPDSVTSIMDEAFSGCSGLSGSLTLPSGVTTIGVGAFFECDGLTGDLVLPSGLKSVSNSAFANCRGLNGSLVLPKGLENIDAAAFENCDGIMNISIPGSVTNIGHFAFRGCNGITNVYYEGDSAQWDSIRMEKDNDSLKNANIYCNSYYSADNMPPTFGNMDNPVVVIKPSGSSTPIYTYRADTQAYRTYADTVDSYLYDNGNGLTRVEFCNGKVVIENYDSSFRYQTGWTLDPELPLWGGFYAGEKYNFLIFGQNNPGEDNATEVIRVVKYDKEWNRLNHASLKGANTVVPFDAGSLRCDEYGDMLYVHTCHKMYADKDDGLNHQANLTFSVRETDMWITDQISKVANVSKGYVSHSFNQFLLTDREGNIVTLDHGDAYPRSAVLIRYGTKAGRNSFSSERASWVDLFEFPGNVGNNNTNASIGGLAETGSGYIAAYNYSPDNNYEGIRNIHISYLPKDSFVQESVHTWTSEVATGTTPVVASAGSDGGYVLWRSPNMTNGIQYVRYDEQGNISLVRTCDEVLLSDCQPILYQGNMVWYATNPNGLLFYTLSESGIAIYDSNGSKQPTPVQQNPDLVRDFVSRMYTVALGRDAEPQGLNDWSNRLLTRTVDGSGIANGFIMSEEFTNKNVSDETYVNILYRTFFDREADAGGKANWMAALTNGNSRGYVLAGFVNSVEFDDLCGKFGITRGVMETNEKAIGPGVRQFVNRCYVKVLGREGEPAGVSDWIGRIARGEETPESTAKLFFFSEEYANKNTSNEEFVETLYQTFMDRASDPAGKSDWLGRLAAGTSREEVLEGFSRSAEFAEILESFGL